MELERENQDNPENIINWYKETFDEFMTTLAQRNIDTLYNLEGQIELRERLLNMSKYIKGLTMKVDQKTQELRSCLSKNGAHDMA